MADRARLTPETETPVNPYSLLEAVNSSSDTSHTGWLIFLAIMTYLMIAVAGVTHEALLLETPVQLPILQVKIQLKQFFQFAPIVLVLFHLGILAQLVLLARKTLEFDHAIRFLETSDKRTHPLRLELHNFFFVQGIAGPQRSAVMSGFLNIMSWLTIVILPVVLLLYMQVAFLPYHDVTTTWINRIFLSLDIAGLLLIGVFLMRAETSFFQAFWRSTFSHPLSAIATTLVLALVAYLSFFAATVPGEPLDRVSQKLMAWSSPIEPGKVQQGGFSLPFISAASDGTLFGVFRRNLVVTDSDLKTDREDGEKTLRLRGRDLRYAKLDRTDLSGADLTGASLDGASLVGANLQNASLSCAEPDLVMLSDNRDGRQVRLGQGRRPDPRPAEQGAPVGRRSARRQARRGAARRRRPVELAAHRRQPLQRASGKGRPHRRRAGAGRQLPQRLAAGCRSHRRAIAAGRFLQRRHAGRGAELRAPRGRRVARCRSRSGEPAAGKAARHRHDRHQDGRQRPARRRHLDDAAAGVGLHRPQRFFGASRCVRLTKPSAPPCRRAWSASPMRTCAAAPWRSPGRWARRTAAWTGTIDQQRWQSWVGASPVPPALNYKVDLTNYLTKLMCSARWSNGAIATGIARRAVTAQFRGDVVAVYDNLKASTCPAATQAPPKVMKDLSAAAETARF